MTDKNCALLDDDQEYEIISSKTGNSVRFVSDSTVEEQRNICIHVMSADEGEIAAHVIASEF